jgi:hypothetical protein
MAYAGAFKNPPKTTREIMEPKTYLAHEKLEPLKLIDMNQDFKNYDAFDIGAMGEFDVDVLVEQYAGSDKAAEIYPAWRGGYYFAGRPKTDKSAPLGVFYVSRWSSDAKAAEFAAVYAKSLAKRYQKQQPLDSDGEASENKQENKKENVAVQESQEPPVESWRTLRGRHAWLTEEGLVVIEVRGDEVLITESLDDATTKQAEADFWPEEKPTPSKP